MDTAQVTEKNKSFVIICLPKTRYFVKTFRDLQMFFYKTGVDSEIFIIFFGKLIWLN